MFNPPPQRLRASREAVGKLYDELAKALPSGRVIRDSDILESYAQDESGAGSYPPQLLVRPLSTQHVSTTLEAAMRCGVPVVPRGGGTGRAGGCLAIEGGLVLSLESMNRILSVDPGSMTATVEPGVITGDLHEAVEAEGLFYPPDPSSLDSCHIGGNVATNASGARNPKYGCTRNQVLGLEMVLPSGRLLRTGGRSLKGVAGYDLTSLICGSEGTLAIMTQITVRLLPRPPHVETALMLFPGVDLASRAVVAIMRAGHNPRALEMMDHVAVDAVRGAAPFRFPEGNQNAVILELDGTDREAVFSELAEIGEMAQARLGASLVLVAKNNSERRDLWESRRVMSPSLREKWGMKYAEDVAVPLDHVPRLVELVHRRAEQSEIACSTYGHAGDGSLHVNLLFNDESAWPAVTKAAEGVYRDAVSLGGTITSEHGIGLIKRDYLPWEQSSPLIALQRGLKNLFDPEDLLNPGKIFLP